MTGIASAWSALGGDPSLLSRVTTVARESALAARLPVRELARSSVGACALAAAELAARRAGTGDVPAVRVDDGAVATAFTSERQLLVDGRPPVTFAPLSRFWRAADGWVRTHANYPHHRERLLAALGVPDDVRAVESALAGIRAARIEEAVYAAGAWRSPCARPRSGRRTARRRPWRPCPWWNAAGSAPHARVPFPHSPPLPCCPPPGYGSWT